MFKGSKGTTMVCDDQPIKADNGDSKEMDVTDLLLLCQLFYLPAEHGQVSQFNNNVLASCNTRNFVG